MIIKLPTDIRKSRYLATQVSSGCDEYPLFRWDNYLSIHLAAFESQVESVRSIDHGDGDNPQHPHIMRPRADEMPPNLLYWLHQDPTPWIINVDLDYFFCMAAETDDGSETWIPMFSDDFIDCIFGEIKKGLDEGIVGVVTVCLTPTDFTPGWDNCLDLSRRIFNILGADHPDI